MEGDSIVVQLKVKGFVSNIYVYLNMFLSAFGAFLFATLAYFIEHQIILSIVLFSVFFIFDFFSPCLYAKYAYVRFCIDEKGIKCGKKYITYDSIKDVNLVEGSIEEKIGPFKVDNYTGRIRGIEIFLEDMICINCDFSGFKGANQGEKFYIPRNKKTDMILKKYCKRYANYISENSRDNTNANFDPFRPKIKHNLILSISLIMLALIVFAIVVGGMGKGVLFAAIIVAFFDLSILLKVLRGHISYFLRNSIAKKLDNT